MRKWLFGLALLGAPLMANDALAQGKDLSLERVFASPDLAGTAPLQAKLSPDGKYLTLLRNRADEKERYDLWAMDTATGKWRMLVDSKKVGTGAELSEAEKMQRERNRSIVGKTGIVGYDWAADGQSILVPLDGELYLATLDGKVTRLTKEKGSKLNPVISPAGGYVSYVNDQNLVVGRLDGRAPARITDDGKGTVHWGEAEFVAQEEMDRFTGYWWSPGDRYIAVERFDEAPVGVMTRAAIGATGTSIYEQRYPKAGTANVLADLYVMDPAGANKVKVDLGKDTDIYLTRVNWAPDASALYVQRMNRDQSVLDVLKVDPATGKSKILFSEKSGPRSWVNLSSSFKALADGSILWWSERDGHGHIYRWKAGKWTQLTKGAWEVAGISGVDEAKGRIFFLGNKDGVLEKHLYAIDIAKPATVTRLTESGWWNSATMDQAASRVIVTRSNANQPSQTYLADTSGKRIAWVSENDVAKADHPYNAYLGSHRERTFGTIKGPDGTTLQYEMITPRLEPGKRYPVFFQHYGGPHSQTVSRAWGGAFQQYIVDRGYIWFQIDNRGSANRGKVFEDAIYHAMGSVEVDDQVAGAKYLKTLDFVDAKRINTYGWSYGGYMTLKMLEAAPGVFAAGVAGAPVTKWELYDTFYTERYMGDPTKVPEAYKASSTIPDARKITDPLLILHGMADDNVFLDNTTSMVAEMQTGNVPFEMMLYPGYTHRVGGAVSMHLWSTIFNFLERDRTK